MGQLSDRVALITGGTAGIGLATARRFIKEGAFVYITGRRRPELDAAVENLGTQAAGVQGDVADPHAIDQVISAIRQRHGRLDIVFVNAGGGSVLPLTEITQKDYDRHFSVNVAGALFTVQKALPLMTNGGSIILVGSVSASRNVPQMSLYGATKAALRSLGRSWAYELTERGIRVNILSPGPIDTPATYVAAGAHDDESRQQVRDQMGSSIPLARIGRPEEVAATAVFLASDQSSFTTGAELFVDGGLGQM
ncbi:SDR family NAD(P)-dependent oxidoreductase [Streptomyces olivaceus]|uniref:SDR family NAD(P)-dependent oxidoreductase n=1 Tax=Streptomyces olivaceus TaxID=47716 RepID=UPI0004C96C58|nr:SDR family oxidoreductase [Streptomyces olivaceus]MBZ6102264.1 SDR family oxidoreductase [Streptomyces olivaceus]MBZ6284839.1 SDR family oxidoreductase [Streptomyces olivaceus]